MKLKRRQYKTTPPPPKLGTLGKLLRENRKRQRQFGKRKR